MNRDGDRLPDCFDCDSICKKICILSIIITTLRRLSGVNKYTHGCGPYDATHERMYVYIDRLWIENIQALWCSAARAKHANYEVLRIVT